jgi:hypothetical protein
MAPDDSDSITCFWAKALRALRSIEEDSPSGRKMVLSECDASSAAVKEWSEFAPKLLTPDLLLSFCCLLEFLDPIDAEVDDEEGVN